MVPAPSLGLPNVAAPTVVQLQLGALLVLGVAAYGFYLKKTNDWADDQA